MRFIFPHGPPLGGHDMNRLRRLRVGLRTLLAVSMAVLAVSTAHAADVVLDDLERYYLSQTPVVSLCVDPDWSPFESIDENGQYVGISADLLRLISIRTGVRFSLKPTKTWDESIEEARSGNCQALSFLNETPERKGWLAFTDPVFTDVNVFITREEHPFISDPSGLVGATLVLPKGTGVEEFVRKRYPNLRIITVESENDAFRIVSERQADMTLRSLIMAAYTIKKDGWFNLKISGQLPEFNNKLRIGLTRDRQNLVSILNKGIATITAQDRETIVNRHISINAQTVEDYALAWKVATVLLLVLAVASAWVRQLRKHNRELALLSQTDGPPACSIAPSSTPS